MAALYTDQVMANGTPLEIYVGFMDCTKLKMDRPRGVNSLQR